MKNDLVPLHDILKEIEFLHAIRDRTDLVGFKASPTDVRAASYSIMVISEAVRRIPEAWLDAQPEIPWQAIRGIGNKLRHEYQLISDVILGRNRQACRRVEAHHRGDARQTWWLASLKHERCR
jgi:uncharacterized protein with HEPN domain